MTGEQLLRVRIDDRGLELVDHDGPRGVWYSLPSEGEEPTVSLPRQQALHADLRPTGSAAHILRAWCTGNEIADRVEYDEPAETAPRSERGAAVVCRNEQILAIAYRPEKGGFFIPGGGVEEGETPEQAAIRELHEETGLHGTVQRKLATVYNRGRYEHYFLVEASGIPAPHETLDLYPGETLTWIDIAALPTTPIWPRRLAWRIAYWWSAGWPSQPAVIADSLDAAVIECDW